MRFATSTIFVLAIGAAIGYAQPAAAPDKSKSPALVDFGMMTWPEVKRAIHEQGKTTALIYNGGTEQRGPQNVNGATP
jgi:creatinine amidohydrolase